MGKFRQYLTESSARDTFIFSFPDDNLSKNQQIFTKLGLFIDTDIVGSGLGMFMDKFCQFLTVIFL